MKTERHKENLLSNMLTQQTAIDTVRNYARDIEAKGVNLRTVILYGSFAKGTQHEWSDIDVALVADEFTGFTFNDKKLFPYVGIKPKHTLPIIFYRAMTHLSKKLPRPVSK